MSTLYSFFGWKDADAIKILDIAHKNHHYDLFITAYDSASDLCKYIIWHEKTLQSYIDGKFGKKIMIVKLICPNNMQLSSMDKIKYMRIIISLSHIEETLIDTNEFLKGINFSGSLISKFIMTWSKIKLISPKFPEPFMYSLVDATREKIDK